MNIEAASSRRTAPAVRDAWSPIPPAEAGIDMRALFGAVSFRRWMVAACAGVFATAAAVVALQLPDRYGATAQVMLNAREVRIVDIDNVVASLPADARMIEGEIAVILSNELLHDVIVSLGLDRDPDFNPALAEGGLGAFGPGALFGALLGALFGGADAPAATSGAGRFTAEEINTIKTLRQMIAVEQVGLSLVIAMRVTAPAPDKAAAVANALAERYIDNQLQLKERTTANATAWLRERAEGLRERVEGAERAVEAFKAEMASGAGGAPELIEQQLTELISQLALARSARAEADAALAEAEALRAAGGFPAIGGGVVASSLEAQRRELEALGRERSALATRFGPRNPQLLSLDQRIADLRAEIDAAAEEVVAAMAGAARAARAREAALAADVEALESLRTSQAAATLTLRQLEREAEASREIYQTFLLRLNELSEQSALQQADARIISVAVPPELPTGPNRKLIVAAAGVFGLMVGCALAIAAAAVTTTFRTDVDLRGRLGLRTIARIPRLSRRVAPLEAVAQARRDPFSPLAEAMRDVMTALAGDADAVRVAAVASAMPREGRSTLCVLLADFMRRIDRRVIVLDCDFHGAAIGRALGAGDGPDLVSVIAGDSDVDAAIRHDPVTGADYVPVLDLKGYGPEILHAQPFETLLRGLKARYDLVILDTPPMVVGPDACAVARHADLVLFAVRWNSTSEQQVESAVAKLFQAGARRLGVALTFVDRGREALYRKRVYNLDAA